MQKVKETWEKKLVDVERKAAEIPTKEKSLQEYMDSTISYKNKLDGEVLELTDVLVSTHGIYFEQAKEQVSLIYPDLDLRKLNFLKVVQDSQLVDE